MPDCFSPEYLAPAGSLHVSWKLPCYSIEASGLCLYRADELAGELAATKAELDQEVEDLRDVLNATMEDKAALASQCSALEAQVYAGPRQLMIGALSRD